MHSRLLAQRCDVDEICWQFHSHLNVLMQQITVLLVLNHKGFQRRIGHVHFKKSRSIFGFGVDFPGNWSNDLLAKELASVLNPITDFPQLGLLSESPIPALGLVILQLPSISLAHA
jgi:hypothetical protein